MYICGEHVTKDLDRGIDLYKAAGDQGNSNALFQLGKIYYHGEGTLQKDIDQVLFHFFSNRVGLKQTTKPFFFSVRFILT